MTNAQSSDCLPDLDSLEGITIATRNVSPYIGTAQRTVIPGGNNWESDRELSGVCRDVVPNSE
jgi:hypothetical protein